MTILEWIGLIVIGLVILFGFSMMICGMFANEPDIAATGFVITLFLTIVVYVIFNIIGYFINQKESWAVIKETPIVVKYEKLDEEKLTILTSQNKVLEYNNIKDINDWKNGKTLYLIESFKKDNFGLDDEKEEYIFKQKK